MTVSTGLRLLLRRSVFAALSGLVLLLSGCRQKPANDVGGAASTTEAPLFREVAEAAGLRYEWVVPGKRPLNILQTIGNGCAFLDYDNDGNLDILLVGPKLALYKGDGKGHFTDATAETGLDKLSGHFLGCAVGDYDNDSYDDLYITAYRGGLLLHNEALAPLAPTPDPSPKHRGGGTGTQQSAFDTRSPSLSIGRRGQGMRAFRDVTQAAGLKPQPWSTSAAFIETVPGSGRLDLVIANYARFGPEPGIPQLCEDKTLQGARTMTSCGPRHYTPLKAVLFRNRGGGLFAPPVTLTPGSGRGLGVAGCDYDGSGRQSIAFANDETSGDLLQNRTNGTFQNVGTASGTAYDRDGNVHGGMGLDWGDYDNDGRFDLLVATFQNEAKSLYHNEGSGSFTDLAYISGLGSAAYPYVTFGCKFFDADNDGWLDIALANGHVQDNIAEINAGVTYRQPVQFFHNRGIGEGRHVTFEEKAFLTGADGTRKIVGRGLAVGDYDNDGRTDLLIVDSEGKPLLLHNEGRNANHWLGVRLLGVRSNRDGYGAIVTIQVGGRRLVRHCHADGSYLSASDPRIVFGLGSANAVEALTIQWPSGKIDRLISPQIDRYLALREGQVLAR